MLKARIYFILSMNVSLRRISLSFHPIEDTTTDRLRAFDIKIRVLYTLIPFVPLFDFLRFLMRLVCNANPRTTRQILTICRRKKARNKFARKPASSFVSPDRFFFFQPFVDDVRKEHVCCASPRALHAWIFTVESLFPSYTRGREKKEIWETWMRKEEGQRAGAQESEGPRQVRRRERESACCSEALYPSVERELSVTMVTKRTGRSLSQPPPLRSIRSSPIRL